MMGRQGGDQSQLFYLFNLERRVPACHLLRRIARRFARSAMSRSRKQMLPK
jgi:hypothetical protein